MSDPLSLVKVKIDWAKRRLEELERAKKRFMDNSPYGTTMERNLETNTDILKNFLG